MRRPILALLCLLAFFHKAVATEFYPVSEPYHGGYLPVSPVHTIYFEEYGNPDGVPVLYVHGGPCGGCNSQDARYFDPSHYRVILFDQRGAPKSLPCGEMEDNYSQALIADMEILREHLDVTQWILFGGSWGSTLSIAYGEAHPERCLGFVLRGVFLGREKDYQNVLYGMRKTFPDAWQEFAESVPEWERDDLLTALHKRVMDDDPSVSKAAVLALIRYSSMCSVLDCNRSTLDDALEKNLTMITGSAKAFLHYSINQFFFDENQLLRDIESIRHLPAIIVQGRYDMICPAEGAWELHQAWPGSVLRYTLAGHSGLEPATAKGLLEAMEEIKASVEAEHVAEGPQSD